MKALWTDVRETPIVGVDVECHDDKVCVVQLASWRRGLVLDAVALEGMLQDLLQPLLGDERVCKVFHGHFNDLAWLRSNFSIVVNPPIFDTAASAQELDGMWEDGQPSLQTLCGQYLDYVLDKTYQTADWRQRPMPEEMLQYAATNAQVLLPLQTAIEQQTYSRARTFNDWQEGFISV